MRPDSSDRCKRWVAFLPLGLSFALAACASTDPFQTPISEFATATTSASTAFATLDTQSATNLNTLYQPGAIDAKRVDHDADQCVVGGSHCQLYYVSEGKRRPVNQTSLMPNSVRFLNSIKDYANDLAALEKADATADVQAAYSNTMSAITVAATVVNPAAGVAIGTISKPLGSVVGWGFGQYQSQLKLAAIKLAIPKADDVINQAIPILENEATAASTGQVAALQKDFDNRDTAFLGQATAANLTAEIQSANALDAALAAKPIVLLESLKASHNKLKAAVENPTGDMSDLLSTMTAFLQQANNIKQVAATITPGTTAK